MYNCVLWSGQHLPLPTMDNGHLAHDYGWEPLFASKDDIPLFWWFLLDRFNCFWLDNGTPIFVVDRVSAMVRAEARYAKVEQALLPAQRLAWCGFFDRLKACQGEIFNIQLPVLWQRKFLSNTEHFNSNMKRCLLPLEGGAYGTRQQQEQKRMSVGVYFEQAGAECPGLSGEQLTLPKK